MRLESAKRLLEGTGDTVDAVTAAVGDRDARSFARLFRAQTTLTPVEYRARFGPSRALNGAAHTPAHARRTRR